MDVQLPKQNVIDTTPSYPNSETSFAIYTGNPMQPLDPRLDLYFERIVDVPREQIWRCWTEPKHLMPWFCPLPWKTVECEIDLRPGGRFYTVMVSPEGQRFPNEGCYLEVVENERLTWTNALLPGFRPVAGVAQSEATVDFKFSASIVLEDFGKATRYRAIARHADEAGRNTHAAMGFEAGWGKALEQMVEYIKKM
jgi:uncharacterized protein YndB with AHSA1/START domain